MITKLKESWKRNYRFVLLGAMFGLSFSLFAGIIINPVAEFFDTEFIMDNQQLIDKADAGYSEVCKDHYSGMDCIIKKEWVDFSMEQNYISFDMVAGNGCQYWIDEHGNVNDGLEKKLNNKDPTISYCGSMGFGYGQPTYNLINVGDYWVITSVQRQSMFYHNWFEENHEKFYS